MVSAEERRKLMAHFESEPVHGVATVYKCVAGLAIIGVVAVFGVRTGLTGSAVPNDVLAQREASSAVARQTAASDAYPVGGALTNARANVGTASRAGFRPHGRLQRSGSTFESGGSNALEPPPRGEPLP